MRRFFRIQKRAGKIGVLPARRILTSYYMSSFCFSFIRLRRSLFIHHCMTKTKASSRSSPTNSVVGPSFAIAYRR